LPPANFIETTRSVFLRSERNIFGTRLTEDWADKAKMQNNNAIVQHRAQTAVAQKPMGYEPAIIKLH